MIESLDGATTALQRRIEDLTAELERCRYKGCGSYPRAIGEIEAVLGITVAVTLHETVEAVRKLAAALSTERDAREQAELSERQIRDQCNRQEHGFAQRESALQRDLATERAARDKAEAAAWQKGYDEGAADIHRVEGDRDTEMRRADRAERELEALAARVRELEAAYLQEEQDCIEESDARVAAETALASARELLTDMHAELEDRGGTLTRKMWNRLEVYVDGLTSHPAPEGW